MNNTEILQASYWEHFKVAKDIARYLPPEHPYRLKLEKEMENILKILNYDKVNELRNS